jgi:predicted  nucleic acid-binding Zn-ribbon protein
MNRTQALAHLYSLDQQIADHARRARDLETRLADNTQVGAALCALNADQKTLEAQHARLRDRELELKSLEEKIQAVEARLYGGRVTNAKELAGLEQDAAMLKRHRGAVEDVILSLMSEIERLQTRVQEQTRATAELQTAAAQTHQDLTRKLTAIRAEQSELAATREKLRSTLAPADLAQYEQIAKTHAGRPVALVKNAACGVCGVAVPTGMISRLRAGEELVFCSSCGRILAE